jgi:hypothetical protein
MVIPVIELNVAMAVVGQCYHSDRIRFHLAYWPYITGFVHECMLHREVQRSIKFVDPTFRTGFEYRINNEVSHNFIPFLMVCNSASCISYLN